MPLVLLPLCCVFAAPQAGASPTDPCVVLPVKTYTVKDIAKYKDAFSYKAEHCAFWREDTFICLRPLYPAEQAGEAQVCSPRTGKVTRLKIPQPRGFTPKWDDESYFGDNGIWVNGRGDFFVRWMLGGNGDHGLALFSKESKGFSTQRSDLHLANSSRAIANPEGSWYLLTWNGIISVYEVDDKLNLKRLGSHDGLGHHWFGVLDACFVSKDVLHFVYVEVDGDNRAHFRTVDFNVAKKTWSPRRTLARFEKFVSSAHPVLVVLEDKSVHYLWSVDEGNKPTADTGLYYLADGKKTPVRLSASVHFKAVAQGSKLVVCYTLDESPNKVFFRVFQGGVPGPETALTVARGREHNLWGEDMVLASAGKDLLWLVNTQEINTFHELKVVPVETRDREKK